MHTIKASIFHMEHQADPLCRFDALEPWEGGNVGDFHAEVLAVGEPSIVFYVLAFRCLMGSRGLCDSQKRCDLFVPASCIAPRDHQPGAIIADQSEDVFLV